MGGKESTLEEISRRAAEGLNVMAWSVPGRKTTSLGFVVLEKST